MLPPTTTVPTQFQPDGMSQAGSVVFKSGDDLIIGFTTITGSTVNTMLNVIDGATAIKTTVSAANATFNSDNFGFTILAATMTW